MARDEWTRLEGRHTTRDVRKGLQARIADPLWMLSRQWQFGEFQGEDASNPAKVSVTYESIPVETYQTKTGLNEWGEKFEIKDKEILESLVEKEDLSKSPVFIRMSAEAGIQFLRRFEKTKRPSVLAELKKVYSHQEVPKNLEGKDDFLNLLLEKSFNGAELFKTPNKGLKKLIEISGLNRASVNDAFTSWKAYYKDRFEEPDGKDANSWKKDRMEYSFSVSTKESDGVKVQLDADEYFGGRLDWFNFDLNASKSKLLNKTQTKQTTAHLIPTPVRYPGMPADRFWSFEDGKVFFGGLSSSATDISQLLLTEYATVYSNDWYMLPLTVDVGSLSRITSLKVSDSFGEEFDVDPAAVIDGKDRNWKFFELNGDPSAELGKSPWLYVPRTLLGGEEDRPVEEVVLTRDDMANMAWGIEQTLESASGHRIERQAQWMRHRDQVEAYLGSSEVSDEEKEAWIYRFISIVPPHWVPFTSEIVDDRVTNRLVRGRMGEWDLLEDLKDSLAGGKGLILDPSAPMFIQEEEIPRGAIQVTRAYQMARSSDGKLVLWCSRNKKPFSGNKASGRQTDVIEMGEV